MSNIQQQKFVNHTSSKNGCSIRVTAPIQITNGSILPNAMTG